jgi:hypothetical protein
LGRPGEKPGGKANAWPCGTSPCQVVTERHPDVRNNALKAGKRGNGAQCQNGGQQPVFNEVLAFAVFDQTFEHTVLAELSRPAVEPGVSCLRELEVGDAGDGVAEGSQSARDLAVERTERNHGAHHNQRNYETVFDHILAIFFDEKVLQK